MTEELFRDSRERPLQVSELIECLREVLDEGFGDVWVEGEISSLYRSRPGHLYFDLKDPEGQLRGVMFRPQAERLPLDPQDGMQVRVHGRVDIYTDRGDLQLVVDHLEPCGAGALRLAFERLKARLYAEGLFDDAHKKPLPFLPRRIGLVTSRQGAAMHDFMRGLRRRAAPVEVVVFDSRVQGEGAWREVVRGLHLLDADAGVDVIVLARGGGSIEDLWTFNQEEVVRAIFETETPVVSAIGHEIDWVLADLVADVRAATPTAAADRVVPDAAELRRRVDGLTRRLLFRERALLRQLGHRLDALRRGVRHPGERLAESAGRLGRLQARLLGSVRLSHERVGARITEARQRLSSGVQLLIDRRSATLSACGGRLDALSPLAVLGRGYSITRRESDGRILKSSREAEPGAGIRVQLWRGSLRASVTESTEET
jgi:exodeoxyribonuclease VII large subunit